MKRALTLAIVTTVGLTLAGPAFSGKRNKDKSAPAPAAAEPAPEASAGPHAAIVKYRHVLLEGVAKHFGMAKMILMGKVDRPGDLVVHAKAIEGSFKEFGGLFPEGSGPDSHPRTEALPTVWSDWEGFQQSIATIQTEAATFTELAEAGDLEGAKAQFGKVGAACGGCHESFRKDED